MAKSKSYTPICECKNQEHIPGCPYSTIPLAKSLSWIDRFVVRPNVIHDLMKTQEYSTMANPWYRKWVWAPADKQARNAWPWRIRLDFMWNGHSIVLGLLYYARYYQKPAEFGFGFYAYEAGDGWIEGVAT